MARRSGLQGLAASCACAMGIAAADQAGADGAVVAEAEQPEIKAVEDNFGFEEITI